MQKGKQSNKQLKKNVNVLDHHKIVYQRGSRINETSEVILNDTFL